MLRRRILSGIKAGGTPVELIPAMTSNTSPSGYVASASSQYSTRSPYRAFDGVWGEDSVDRNKNNTWTGYSSAPQWLQIELPTAKVIKKAALMWGWSSSAGTYCYFKIQGSNDGSNWADISELTYAEAKCPTNINAKVEVNCTSNTAYKYIRWYISTSNYAYGMYAEYAQLWGY